MSDVAAVYEDWGGPGQRGIATAHPDALAALTFLAGSMGPEVEAACPALRWRTGPPH